MTFALTSVNVDDDPAVKIVDASGGHVNHPKTAVIAVGGANEVYIGPSGVTAATGVQLANGASYVIPGLIAGDDIYAICASAETATVKVALSS